MSKRGFRKGFKAPRKSEDGSPAGGLTKDGSCTPAASNLQEEMKRLLAEETELDTKIKKLQDDNVHQETLKTYIDLLHKYNEVKDVAQTVMGCIAVREGVPNRDIGQRYDAPDN